MNLHKTWQTQHVRTGWRGHTQWIWMAVPKLSIGLGKSTGCRHSTDVQVMISRCTQEGEALCKSLR